jgi:glycerophosphoryl diester phosphodiesterase
MGTVGSPDHRQATRTPIGFAHRGARAECQDNTLASFRRALELGAHGLESDVWLTADGVAVLDHDGVVRRGVRRAPIRALRRADLPGHIPSLTELYRECGCDFDLSLDVKDPAAAPAVVDAAGDVGALERTWLCGRGPVLEGWRGLSERVRLVESTRLDRIPGGVATRARQLDRAKVDAVNLRWPDWTATRVADVHRAGLLAFAWDTQRVATIATVLALGVDAVYSDHVERLVEVLAPLR